MRPSASANPYKHYSIPGEMINHAVWLYFRFPLSHRNMEERLLARSISVLYAAIRTWCRKYWSHFSSLLPSDKISTK